MHTPSERHQADTHSWRGLHPRPPSVIWGISSAIGQLRSGFVGKGESDPLVKDGFVAYDGGGGQSEHVVTVPNVHEL